MGNKSDEILNSVRGWSFFLFIVIALNTCDTDDKVDNVQEAVNELNIKLDSLLTQKDTTDYALH